MRPLVVLTALLVGLAFAAPVDAAPILISGEYTLNIDGFVPGDPGYHQTVTQSVVGDFSDSLSDAADVPPNHSESAAGVSLLMSDDRIEAFGSAEALATTGTFPYSLASATVELELSFLLTIPHFVEGMATFDVRGHFRPQSLLTSDIPVAFEGGICGDPDVYTCFEGMLMPGTYSIHGWAHADEGGPDSNAGGYTEFSFGLSLAAIPEPTSAFLFVSGFMVVAAGRRRR